MLCRNKTIRGAKGPNTIQKKEQKDGMTKEGERSVT
jgi:hypothetical protein